MSNNKNFDQELKDMLAESPDGYQTQSRIPGASTETVADVIKSSGQNPADFDVEGLTEAMNCSLVEAFNAGFLVDEPGLIRTFLFRSLILHIDEFHTGNGTEGQ